MEQVRQSKMVFHFSYQEIGPGFVPLRNIPEEFRTSIILVFAPRFGPGRGLKCNSNALFEMLQ